jgi:hypothetical protein
VQQDTGLIFPTTTGRARDSIRLLGIGKKVDGRWVDPFKAACAIAGIEERPGLVWYCLRHSCATSLLEGWWGPPWSLEEVSEMLGHSSVSVTEGYIHSTGSRLRGAVKRMPQSGYAVVTPSGKLPALESEKPSSYEESRESGLNRRPALYESEPAASDVGTLEAMGARFTADVTNQGSNPSVTLTATKNSGASTPTASTAVQKEAKS